MRHVNTSTLGFQSLCLGLMHWIAGARRPVSYRLLRRMERKRPLGTQGINSGHLAPGFGSPQPSLRTP